MMPPKSQLQAVVLSGGGSRGAYEVGVMKALLAGKAPGTDPPVAPAIYSGTSCGALNAALMASLWDLDGEEAVARCEKVWLSSLAGRGRFLENGAYRLRCNPLDLFSSSLFEKGLLNPARTWFGDQFFLVRELLPRVVELADFGSIDNRLCDLADVSAFFDTSPAAKTIRECIAMENISRSPVELMITTTNWTKGRLEVFSKQDFLAKDAQKLILASAALPGIFPPVDIGGDLYQDGGVTMNTPLKPAIDAGAQTLYAIYMDPDPQLFAPRKLHTSLDVLSRALAINAASIMNSDIERAAQINRIVALTSRFPGLPPDEVLALEGRSPGSTPHKALTIHRFHPSVEFGGVLGALDFETKHIGSLIQQGFDDASNHNCRGAGCVLPA